MSTAVRSYAKVNIGLRIGAKREDGFHELGTVYQTIAIHDTIKVDLSRGVGIVVRCKNREDARRVPEDETNTCYRIADRALKVLGTRGKVTITIDKKLPVQGGMGAASSNAVATLLALEQEAKKTLPMDEKLRLVSEVGSDLPLFLIGGAVLGTGRGEQVFPLPDLPQLHVVAATPAIGVSTPAAFAAWDAQFASGDREGKLTDSDPRDKMNVFNRAVSAWLSSSSLSGVSQRKSNGDRAEAMLLDLVRAGIENDFERVVFPQHPDLREVKRVLEREGAAYASLSGSGSTVYGLFSSRQAAQQAAERLGRKNIPAVATVTLARKEYWGRILSA